MTKIIYFQGVGGASGDMILGALQALGADLSAVEAAVRGLSVEPVTIRSERAESHGLNGVRVSVDAPEPHAEGHSHPPHRGMTEIREMIGRADGLSDRVRETALRVFERIAEAEAAVHDVPVETIHFHEVGALDSIADVVGGCVALEQLGVDRVCVAPLPLGTGTVECAHGVYPVPAPATLRLLEGVPVVHTDEPFELVTPTGAALLTTWSTGTHPPPGARIARSGFGFGHRRLDRRPNVLRATLYETDSAGTAPTECLVMECQVDDTTPELIGALCTRLLEAGALDVFTTGVQMKKQRPGNLVTVLCDPSLRDTIADLVFRETTTFGIRETLTTRTMLERRTETVATEYGDIRIKIGTWRGEDITASPEMDDCQAAADSAGVPVRTVYEAAQRAVPGP